MSSHFRNLYSSHPRWSRVAVAVTLAATASLSACAGAAPDHASLSGTSGADVSQLVGRLYVDPNSQAAAWVKAHPGNPAARLIQKEIAAEPTGKWFGAWSGDITSAVSKYTSAAADA